MAKKNRHKQKHKTAALPGTMRGGRGWGVAQFLMPPPAAVAEPPWRLLPWILFAAFVLRAAVSLAGDFVIHPDEIMQYLEPAHKVVFGGGIAYWEYFFGARSWIVPGFVAGLLQICAWLGADSPAVYIAVVKLAFCALSLLVPYGMYAAGRHLFGEKTARCALLLGAFWYELIGFAHKPMTEFVATSLLFLLFALLARPPSPLSAQRAAAAVLLGVLVVAVRFHYAPLAGLVLFAEFWRAQNSVRAAMVAAAAAAVVAVGLLDYFTWGNFFHSYLLNFQVNLYLGDLRAGESSAWNFIGWLLLASGGLVVAASAVFLDWRRRHLWILLLLAAVLLPHMWESHREYRFVFAAIPLWLWLLADVLANGYPNRPKLAKTKWWLPGGLAYAGLVSLLGIFNLIPFQHLIYIGYSKESGYVGFVREQDPVFSVYRDLAKDSSVKGVWDLKHPYFRTGGYYYLHKKIPFYDLSGSSTAIFPPVEAADYVSHIVGVPLEGVAPRGVVQTGSGNLAMRITADGEEQFLLLPRIVRDLETDKLVYWDEAGTPSVLDDFAFSHSVGDLSVWKVTDEAAREQVREWEKYSVAPDSGPMYEIVREATSVEIPQPPENGGIKLK